MNSHEVVGKFFLELLQGLLDQFLTGNVAYRDILLLRLEIHDIRHRDQPQLVLHTHGHVIPHGEIVRAGTQIA